jgi:hypothetical protein
MYRCDACGGDSETPRLSELSGEARIIALWQEGLTPACDHPVPGELAHTGGGGALSITGAVVHAG